VHVDDLVPAGISGVTATGGAFVCVATGNDVDCDLATLAEGASATITITGTAGAGLASGTTLANTASVTSSTPDPTASNNTATVTSAIVTAPDLVTTKELVDPAPPIAPGQIITFRITVTNDGPSVARDVSLLEDAGDFLGDILDVRTEDFEPIGNCILEATGLRCELGDLAPGASVSLDTLWLVAPFQALGPYVNRVQVATTTPEPNTANNTSLAGWELTTTRTDVIVAKQGPAQLAAGSPFTYRLDVSNGEPPFDFPGIPSTAEDVVVTDTLPAGLVPNQAQSTQGNCSISGQTVTCNLGDLDPWIFIDSVQITITGTADPTLDPQTVTNTAVASSSTTDTDPTSDSASFDTDIVQSANVSVTKTADADPLVAGSVASYTVTVSNAGPSTASNVVVTDVLPGAVVFDPAASDSRCEQAPGTGPVNCTIPTIGPSDSVVLNLSGTLDPAFTGASVDNTVSVASSTPDPDNADNTVTITTRSSQVADLVLTKAAANQTPAAGDPAGASYAITLRNNGPSDAADVVLTDSIPAGTTLAGAVQTEPALNCTATDTEVTCPIGAFPAGSSQSLVVALSLPASFPGGPMTNTATATTSTGNPDPPPVEASATVDVAVIADLVVTKTIVDPAPPDPLVAGGPVTYDISVTNNGPSDAPNVVFSDTLPEGVGFLGGVPPPRGTCSVAVEEDLTIVGCQGDLLEVGETLSGRITLGIPPGFQGSLANTASIGSGALDRELVAQGSQNESTARSSVTAVLDVAVDAAAGTPRVAPGELASFTITVTNNGPSTARGVTLVHELPAGLAVVAGNGILQQTGCTLTGRTATCELGNFRPEASRRLTFSGRVPANAVDGTAFTDRAEITAEGDTNPPNDVDTARVIVVVQVPPSSTTTTTTTTSSTTSTTTTTVAGSTTTTTSPGSGSGGGQLPVTGLAIGGLLLVATGLVATGGLGRLVRRRPGPGH
jgi:uncharacterized repeat protein (TIGR01451 family)